MVSGILSVYCALFRERYSLWWRALDTSLPQSRLQSWLDGCLLFYSYSKIWTPPYSRHRTLERFHCDGCRPHKLSRHKILPRSILKFGLQRLCIIIPCLVLYSDAKTLTWSFGVEDYNMLGLYCSKCCTFKPECVRVTRSLIDDLLSS